jgi:hypothetical protein
MIAMLRPTLSFAGFNVNVGDRKILGDYVAVLGDSFVIEGVRIKVVGTGDYETIEISKG